MVTDIIEATKKNNLDQVQQILDESHESPCNTVDDWGRNALHWATEFGYFKITRILISALEGGGSSSTHLLSSLLNLKDARGQTALHIACNTKREDAACSLVSLGSELSVFDHLGNTPLHRAVRMNLEKAASVMCEYGADVNARNATSWTPLHEAARVGNENIVKLLIRHGAYLDPLTDNKMTPFLTAFFYYGIASKSNSYPNLENVWRILIEAGCCLSKGDGHWTPLTAAVSCDNSFIASILLLNGCKLERKGRYGRSILQEIFISSEPTLVKLIVLLGLIPSTEEISYCSKQLPMYSKCFVRLPGLASAIHKDRHHVVRWLKDKQRQPPSLKLCCRTSIRQAMNVSNGDRSIISGVQYLPIPNSLKRYLNLSDFVQDLSTYESLSDQHTQIT